MLSWCVQTVKSTYEWGTYEEEIVSSYVDSNNTDGSWPWYTFPTPNGTFYVYNQNLTLEPPSKDGNRSNANLFSPRYGMNNITAVNVMKIFDNINPSFYTVAHPTAKPLLRFLDISTRQIPHNLWQAPNNQSEHFEKMAQAMTNVVRSSIDTVIVTGKAYSMKSFIKINWAWLVFPFVLLLLSLAFLVSTIKKTSKDGSTGVWKTSTMPTLIYGLPKDTRGKFATESAWNGSHRDVKKVRIKLLPKQGWRVSGQSLLRSPLLPTRSQPPPGWI
jgi:hypothetical protein